MRAVVAAVLLAGLVLAGCSGSEPSSAPAVSPTETGTPTSATSSGSSSHPPSAVRKAAPNPCIGNSHGKLVRVEVKAQHLWMCRGGRIVHETAVTTGVPGPDTHTPRGDYRVQSRDRDTSLTLLSGRTYRVRFWIPFDGPLFGFHDSSWQKFPYGSDRYRRDGSHGCVHMPLAAIRTLYHWADVGTRVRITS